MLARTVGAVVLLLAAAAILRADDGPIGRDEVDRRVVWTAYEASLLGTEIFNKGKHEECLRLYQGTLAALQPFLDHRPQLKDSVKEKLDRAQTMKAAEAAFLLREALDQIQNEIAPSSGSDAKVEPKPVPRKASLWVRLGGEKTVRAIVKDLIAAAVADKAVNFDRNGTIKLDAKAHARLEQLFVELISLMSGGPFEYSEKRNLQQAHAGMKITDGEFEAFLAVLRKTLEKHKIGKPEAEEVVAHFARTRPVIVEEKKELKEKM